MYTKSLRVCFHMNWTNIAFLVLAEVNTKNKFYCTRLQQKLSFIYVCMHVLSPYYTVESFVWALMFRKCVHVLRDYCKYYFVLLEYTNTHTHTPAGMKCPRDRNVRKYMRRVNIRPYIFQLFTFQLITFCHAFLPLEQPKWNLISWNPNAWFSLV